MDKLREKDAEIVRLKACLRELADISDEYLDAAQDLMEDAAALGDQPEYRPLEDKIAEARRMAQ